MLLARSLCAPSSFTCGSAAGVWRAMNRRQGLQTSVSRPASVCSAWTEVVNPLRREQPRPGEQVQQAASSEIEGGDGQSGTATKSLAERRMEVERKYAEALRRKMVEEGVSSLDELREKVSKARASASEGTTASPLPSASVTEKAARLEEQILARAREEMRRRKESGTGEGEGGKKATGPVKPLTSIINLSKLMSEDPKTISELWTSYHTLKNKLSAVIPADTYREMMTLARRYPKFILPLPREVTVSDEASSDNGAGEGEAEKEKKQGYEMQYMEWAFLPPSPQQSQATISAAAAAGATSPSSPATPLDPARPRPESHPSTVLFTPLAEYKLRQEFAQPFLVLTHYTDLIDSKGLVLMRGEITGVEEEVEVPAGEGGEETTRGEGEADAGAKTRTEVRSKGRMEQRDARLLVMGLQRFYLADKQAGAEKAAEERGKLLRDFHERPHEFDLQKLISTAFVL